MRGLTIIVGSSGSAVRLDEAIALLAAQRALGGPATLFCTGEAVQWLETAAHGLGEGSDWLAGEPTTQQSLAELLDAGGRVIVCQSSMAARELSVEGMDPRIEGGGMVSLLQGLGEDRLIAL